MLIVSPTAFTTSRPLLDEELTEAPVRYPRPSLLAQPLEFEGPKAAQAAGSLGLETVADLLAHLPRDRREARAVAQLVPGEAATVVVVVRASRRGLSAGAGCGRWSRRPSPTTRGR